MTPHARDPDQPGRRTHPLARAILTRATRRLPPARQPWGAAMLAELDHIDGRFEAITWALGSLRVAWRERGRHVSAASTAAARLRRPAPGRSPWPSSPR
jgi:hypothetical protein